MYLYRKEIVGDHAEKDGCDVVMVYLIAFLATPSHHTRTASPCTTFVV